MKVRREDFLWSSFRDHTKGEYNRWSKYEFFKAIYFDK